MDDLDDLIKELDTSPSEPNKSDTSATNQKDPILGVHGAASEPNSETAAPKHAANTPTQIATGTGTNPPPALTKEEFIHQLTPTLNEQFKNHSQKALNAMKDGIISGVIDNSTTKHFDGFETKNYSLEDRLKAFNGRSSQQFDLPQNLTDGQLKTILVRMISPEQTNNQVNAFVATIGTAASKASETTPPHNSSPLTSEETEFKDHMDNNLKKLLPNVEFNTLAQLLNLKKDLKCFEGLETQSHTIGERKISFDSKIQLLKSNLDAINAVTNLKTATQGAHRRLLAKMMSPEFSEKELIPWIMQGMKTSNPSSAKSPTSRGISSTGKQHQTKPTTSAPLPGGTVGAVASTPDATAKTFKEAVAKAIARLLGEEITSNKTHIKEALGYASEAAATMVKKVPKALVNIEKQNKYTLDQRKDSLHQKIEFLINENIRLKSKSRNPNQKHIYKSAMTTFTYRLLCPAVDAEGIKTWLDSEASKPLLPQLLPKKK